MRFEQSPKEMEAVVVEHEIEEKVTVARDRSRHTLKHDGLSEALLCGWLHQNNPKSLYEMASQALSYYLASVIDTQSSLATHSIMDFLKHPLSVL